MVDSQLFDFHRLQSMMSAISVWFASLKANYSANIMTAPLFLLCNQTVIFLIQRASKPLTMKQTIKIEA